MANTYKFIRGRGDSEQQAEINQAGQEGYTVVSMVFDPNAQQTGAVIVLLEKVATTAQAGLSAA